MRVIGFVLATLALTSVCADKTFSIVENGGLSTLSFNISGTVVDKPQLNVTFGETITFRIEHFLQSTLDNKIIPFGLTASALALPQDFTSPAMGSLTPSNSCVLSTDTPNSWHVNQTTLTPCIITWKVVAPDSGTNFWYSSRNQAYAGPIEISGLPTGTPPTSAPGSNTTTSPPTGTTTPVPTTTAPPTGSSTGKNSAAVILPGAAAFICAAINALVA